MNIAFSAARVYAVFMGVGFIVGEGFSGDFSFAATLAGLSGVFAGVRGRMFGGRAGKIVTVVCAAGLVGIAMDAIHYYRELNVDGNDYAWILIAPFIAALLCIGYFSAMSLPPNSAPHQSNII